MITAPCVLHVDASVFYDGRATSTLQRGKYLVIWKADGSFQIHGGDLISPLNYQASGAVVTYVRPSGPVPGMVRAVRKNEVIEVTVYQTFLEYEAGELDVHKIKIIRTEDELVEKLKSNIGSYVPNCVSVVRESPSSHGPIDLLAKDDGGLYHLFEVKRKKATLSACTQVLRYGELFKEAGVKLYVVSPSITKGALKYCDKASITWVELDFDQTAVGSCQSKS